MRNALARIAEEIGLALLMLAGLAFIVVGLLARVAGKALAAIAVVGAIGWCVLYLGVEVL